MKRIVLIVLMALAASAFAADMNLEYLNNALAVETKVVSTSMTSAYGSGNFAVAASEGVSSVEWEPYKGAVKIPKSEFFRLTGREDLYNMCRETEEFNARIEKKENAWLAASIVGLGASLGLEIIGAIKADDELMLASLVGASISLIPMFVGLVYHYQYKDIEVSASFAAGMADIYNKELAVSLGLSF